MSAGNPVKPIRLPHDLLKAVHEEINRRNRHCREEPWTFSDYVREALHEKIAKGLRSRTKKNGKPPRS